MEISATFEIPYYQVLTAEGDIHGDLPEFAKDPDKLLTLYRYMVLNRVFDTKAIALQRTGKLGTYPSTRGQEAVFVGLGDALHAEDIFVPYYRDIGTLMQRGVDLSEILLFWGGDERGNCFAHNKTDFPFSVPISTQLLHAAGVATALQIRKQPGAVLTVCGDGGTSEGDFYEALNVAGVWNLPVVFVINNNQWAISVPRSAQTKAQTLAQKAIAAGIPGEQVDGNDVLAVRYRVAENLKRARLKHQPALIELICYRQHDHTTADDASRYEPKHIREAEWKKEPIARLRHYLESLKIWDAEKESALQQTCVATVDQAVQTYLNTEANEPVDMFDYLYATLPAMYHEQREQLLQVKDQS